MRVTKQYLYSVQFEAGSVDVYDAVSMESLRQAISRAHGIPEHRIAIEAHDDPSDAREVGVAMRRLEALRRLFSAEGIVEQRLEMQTHSASCCQENQGRSARRAEVLLFPRVKSLCLEVGDPFLSFQEVSVLGSAREAAIPYQGEKCRRLEEQYSKYEWKRIVGYESLKKWAEAGARHPLYDED